jgi:hypothetical protein
MLKLLSVSFKRDIRLIGNLHAPKSICMTSKEDARDWALHLDYDYFQIVVTCLKSGEFHGWEFNVPLNGGDVDAWVRDARPEQLPEAAEPPALDGINPGCPEHPTYPLPCALCVPGPELSGAEAIAQLHAEVKKGKSRKK